MTDFSFWQSVWTVVALLAFLGIVAWAWSGRRRKDFEAAARIALDDDRPPADDH